MSRWAVVPASPRHINRIANRMRQADRLECAAAGHGPKDALRFAYLSSVAAWTGLKNGEPECMGGVAPVSTVEGRGAAWLLGTDAVYTGGRELLTVVPAMLDAMQKDWRILEGMVWSGNTRAIRWMRRCGFDISEDLCEMGGIDFRRFQRAS